MIILSHCESPISGGQNNKWLTFELMTKKIKNQQGQLLGNDKKWYKIFIRVIIHISFILDNNMIMSLHFSRVLTWKTKKWQVDNSLKFGFC